MRQVDVKYSHTRHPDLTRVVRDSDNIVPATFMWSDACLCGYVYNMSQRRLGFLIRTSRDGWFGADLH